MNKNIKANYFYNVVYQTLNIIIPLITAPYLARALGAESMGIYAYTYSIAYYFMMFALLGVNNYGNRICAMCRDDKNVLGQTFCEIYFLQLVCSSIFVLFYILFILIWNSEYLYMSLIMSGFVLSAAFDINWFFFGLEEFKLTTLRSIIVRIIITIFIFAFVKSRDHLFLYAMIMSFGTLISQIIMWPYLKGFITPRKVLFSDIRKHVVPNLVLFIPVIAVSLYKIMDKIMLGSMSTMVETGYYEYTEKIMNIPLGFINALGVVMLPRMSNLSARNELGEARKLLGNSFLFVSFLSIAMAFGLAGIAPEFVPLFFGSEYVPVVQLLEWIAPTIVFFSFANVIRTQYLLPNKKDKTYIISVFTGAAVNLVINYLLIPRFDAYGAVIGTLVAECVVCLMQVLFVAHELPILQYLGNAVPFLLIGSVMMVVIRILSGFAQSLFVSVLIEILVGGAVYLLLSYIYLRLFKKDFVKSMGISRLIRK